MGKSRDTTTRTFRLPKTALEWLEKKAEKRDVTVNEYMCWLLLQVMERNP